MRGSLRQGPQRIYTSCSTPMPGAHRPAASSLGSVLPARWAGKDGRQQHHFKLREKAEAKAAPAFAPPAPIASRGPAKRKLLAKRILGER